MLAFKRQYRKTLLYIQKPRSFCAHLAYQAQRDATRERNVRFRAANAFRLRLILGFSKYWRLRISDKIPSRSQSFLKRFKAFSNGSCSNIFTPAMFQPLDVFWKGWSMKKEIWLLFYFFLCSIPPIWYKLKYDCRK